MTHITVNAHIGDSDPISASVTKDVLPYSYITVGIGNLALFITNPDKLIHLISVLQSVAAEYEEARNA